MYIEDKDNFEFILEIIKKEEFAFNYDANKRIEVLSKIQKKLKDLSLILKKPELLELCIFLKDCSNKYKYWSTKYTYQKDSKGITYHIPSSNIELMPIYSWIPSFIVGNPNLIRISKNLKKDYLKNIIGIINNELGEEENKRQIFFEDTADNTKSKIASSICKVRIIWGGNKTIQEIKETQKSNCSLDIAFNHRVSALLIFSSHFLKLNKTELDKFIKSYLNDTLNLSYNACSSPHLILFIGDKKDYTKVKKSFINLLASNKNNSNSDLGIISTENLFKTQSDVIKNKGYSINPNVIFGRPIIEANISDLKRIEINRLNNASLFIYTNSIDNVINYWRSEIQTVTYVPNTKKELIIKLREKLKGKGPDRIVPIGSALSFDTIWDGMNFFELLTRQNITYV